MTALSQLGALGSSLPDNYVTIIWQTQQTPHALVDVHLTDGPQTSTSSEVDRTIEPAQHSISNVVVADLGPAAVEPAPENHRTEYEESGKYLLRDVYIYFVLNFHDISRT
jgi:hypothetical protein